MKRWIPFLFLALVVAACGEEAESAPGSPPPPGMAQNPWDTLPPESIYGATPAENVRVTPVQLDVLGLPRGWEGTRIAAISDLQLDLWSGNTAVAAAAIDAAVAAQPDMIVLLGDYLGSGTDPSGLAALLAPLRGTPTFAVLGDRDVRSDSLAARIAATLAQAGVRVLRNQASPFVRGGDTASVVGIDADLLNEPAADQAWILSQLGLGTPVGIALAHDPLLAARADNDRVPAALAGGTFCGAVEVPGTPRLSWLNAEALPGAVVEDTRRLYRIGSMVLFVTCGTGYGFIPVRFGSPPEVALVTLLGVGRDEEAEDVEEEAQDTLMQQYEESLADTAG